MLSISARVVYSVILLLVGEGFKAIFYVKEQYSLMSDFVVLYLFIKVLLLVLECNQMYKLTCNIEFCAPMITKFNGQ